MNLKFNLQNMGCVVLAKLENQEKLMQEINAKITNLTNPEVLKSTEPPLEVQNICDCTKTDQDLQSLRNEMEKLRHDLATLHLALETKQTELDEQKLNFDYRLLAFKAEVDPFKLHVALVEEDWHNKVVALIKKAFDCNYMNLKSTDDNFQKVYDKLRRDRDSTGDDILQRNQYLMDILQFCENRFSEDVNDYQSWMAEREDFDRKYLNPDDDLGFAYVKFVMALLTHRSKISDDYIQAAEFWSNW